MLKTTRKQAEKALKAAKNLEKKRLNEGFMYIRTAKNTIILTNKF